MKTTSSELYIDIETYSETDIRLAGLYPYVEDPSFEVLLIAYAWNDEPVRLLDLAGGDYDPWEAKKLGWYLTDPAVLKIAHNNPFERTALGKWVSAYLPPEEWDDTMIRAAYNGLPMSLDEAGAALNIERKKLKSGTALINYFCKPCAPTKANGGRTRNRPEHAPDKWQTFKEYCARDVDAMRQIRKRLKGLPVMPEWEREVWCLDARINERGVLIDRQLAQAAVTMDGKFRAECEKELAALTRLENPNSVAQLKSWLSETGTDVESLNKATVTELRQSGLSQHIDRALELRQLLGKTSVKKYQAMLDSVCEDGRIRGITQYYGTRTGRWAGRKVQLQNLPQNHLEDIADVREIVRAGDLEGLEMLYDSVPDTLSQLIRTAFIAKPGHTLLVADYSAIEARVIAYLAGEEWRQEVFANGGDIYCSSASQMFKVPVEKHGVNAHLRQKGKVAELACIAEGQKVLTDQGLVPIEKVTLGMKLWDGVEWVDHSGVICRGEKEVFNYGGLEATEDHVVWAEVEGKQRPVRFGNAAACGAHLLQTGTGREPIRLGRDHQPGKTLEQALESLLCSDTVQRLRVYSVAGDRQPENGEIQGLSELLTATGDSQMAGQATHSSPAAVYESERPELQELRGAGNRISVRKCESGGSVHNRDLRPSGPGDGAGPDRRERTLRTRQSSLGNASAELPEPAPVSRKVRVYDILNAGPRHRFTVSDVLVHNCGYGGGVNALKAFGADKMGLTDSEMEEIVSSWREASPRICKFWRNVEQAARTALNDPGTAVKLNKGAIRFQRDRDALRCTLPSGRALTYWGAGFDEDGNIVFMGQNQVTRKWERIGTWGGKLVENIVQAFARDCLATALLRLDKAGYRIVFHVHDEIICEMPEGSRWEEMAEIMGQPIDWAPGLLLRAEGYSTPFYMKD